MYAGGQSSSLHTETRPHYPPSNSFVPRSSSHSSSRAWPQPSMGSPCGACSPSISEPHLQPSSCHRTAVGSPEPHLFVQVLPGQTLPRSSLTSKRPLLTSLDGATPLLAGTWQWPTSTTHQAATLQHPSSSHSTQEEGEAQRTHLPEVTKHEDGRPHPNVSAPMHTMFCIASAPSQALLPMAITHIPYCSIASMSCSPGSSHLDGEQPSKSLT